MASAIGTAIINFGAGSNEASVTVTGQTSISATSKTDAFIMADDSTVSHTSSDHRYLACLAGITCGTPVAGEGFVIYATSTQKLQGSYQIRWVWAD